MRCLTGARFTMRADILKPGEVTNDPIDPSDFGEWVDSQDPLTGEIVKKWRPYPDDVTTPTNETIKFGEVKCLVRGIVDGGIRVAGTTERFGDTYQNMEYLKMWVGPHTKITKSDRIVNIRDAKGHMIYLDDEYDDRDPNTPPKATVFNVNGVTPLYDAFSKHVETFILLERAEVE